MNRTLSKEDLLWDDKFRDDFELGNSIRAVKKGRVTTKIGAYVSDFDDLTPADCVFLQLCKSSCDIFIVALPTEYSLRLQGKSSKYPLQERVFRLGSLYSVDYICAFDEKDCGLSLDKIDPSFIFHGRTQTDKEVYSCRAGLVADKFRLIDYPWREERTGGRFFSL